MTNTNTARRPRGFDAAYMMKISIMGALAFVIMLFEIPLAMLFPSFLQLDFSNVVCLIGSLSMGPVAGILTVLVKNLLHLLFKGGATAGVGELADFIVSGVFVATAALYYGRHRTKGGAIFGMCLATLGMVVAGGLVNYFITIPLYGVLLGYTEADLVALGSVVIPAITDKLTLVLFAFCPFNLLKGALLTVITIPLYKRVSPILKRR